MTGSFETKIFLFCLNICSLNIITNIQGRGILSSSFQMQSMQIFHDLRLAPTSVVWT